jgi:hypothetical protein
MPSPKKKIFCREIKPHLEQKAEAAYCSLPRTLLEKRYKRLIKFLESKQSEKLGQGCSREVFIHPFKKGWVIKVPFPGSLRANFGEVRTARSGRYPTAKCRMVSLFDLPCVEMERVEIISTPADFGIRREAELAKIRAMTGKKARWQDWFDEIDCHQIGVTKAGKIVAYDLGDKR